MLILSEGESTKRPGKRMLYLTIYLDNVDPSDADQLIEEFQKFHSELEGRA
jgi:hypothetical protein